MITNCSSWRTKDWMCLYPMSNRGWRWMLQRRRPTMAHSGTERPMIEPGKVAGPTMSESAGRARHWTAQSRVIKRESSRELQ